MRHFIWSLRKWPSKSTQNFTNHLQNTGYLFLQKLHVISHLHDQQHHQDCQIVHDGGCSHCQRCKAQPSAFTQWGQINHCYIARRALLDYVAGLYCRTIVYVDQALLHALQDFIEDQPLLHCNTCIAGPRRRSLLQDYCVDQARLYCNTTL